MKKEFFTVWEGTDSSLIGITRREIQTIPGTAEYFCWFICYAPVDEGTRPLWIGKDSLMVHNGDTINNFSVYINPRGKKGVAKYRYTFYSKETPSDTSFLDIVFDIATVGVEDYDAGNIRLFPNPANSYLNIDVQDIASAQMRMINIEGKELKRAFLNEGNNRLDVATLNRGIYILEIMDAKNKVLKREKVLLK